MRALSLSVCVRKVTTPAHHLLSPTGCSSFYPWSLIMMSVFFFFSGRRRTAPSHLSCILAQSGDSAFMLPVMSLQREAPPQIQETAGSLTKPFWENVTLLSEISTQLVELSMCYYPNMSDQPGSEITGKFEGIVCSSVKSLWYNLLLDA